MRLRGSHRLAVLLGAMTVFGLGAAPAAAADPMLPATGMDATQVWVIAGIAVAVVALGALLLWASRRGRGGGDEA